MSDKFLERDPIYETRAQKILRLSKKQPLNALPDRRQPFKGTGDSSRINLQLENGEPSASIHRDGVSKDIGDFLNIYKNSSTILNDHEGEFSSAPLLLDVNQCVSMNPVSEDIGNILNANQSCIMKVLHHEEVACSSRQEEISKNDDNSHYHVLQNYFENTPGKSISIHSELSSSDDYVNGTEVSSSSEGESTATRRVQNRIKRRLNDKKGSLKSCIEIDGISTDLVNEININEGSIGRNPMDEIINTEEENLESNSNKINKRGGRQINEKKSRKRIRNNNKWKRNVRKKAKDSGMEYMSVTGKLKPAKILQPPCKPSCRKKCYERISEEDRVSLHESFYNLPSDCQNQFLCDSVEEFDKKTQRIRDDKRESRRQYTRKYFLKLKNKVEKTEVCQTMFLNTFSITLMKMRVIVEKKRKLGNSMLPPDGRGKHGNQIKISPSVKESIIQHINLFPAYESHYSRNRTDKKYLNEDLTISKMYRLYKEYCKEKQFEVIANEGNYRKIFVEEFNLSFHKPKNDTCDKCDKYDLILKTSHCEKEKDETIKARDSHLHLAETSYLEKKKDKERSLNDSEYAFISFDLEKCLPTPYLKNNVSFYKRSLWTFNLTFYSVIEKKKIPLCYLWDETIAQRGSAEIASCIRQHLLELPENVKEVSLFSDSCTGQNRNIQVAVMFLNFLEADIANNPCQLKIINQKFLQPGHTHLEADSIHAIIEKEKNKTAMKIDLPRDWANLIRSISRQQSIKVVEMEQNSFLDFKSLLSRKFIHRKVNNSQEKVPWLKIKWLQYRRDEPGKIFYKLSFEEDEQFKVLDISRKRSRRCSSNEAPVPALYSGPLTLQEQKVNDIISVLPYVHSSSRNFYEKLVVSGDDEIRLPRDNADDDDDDEMNID